MSGLEILDPLQVFDQLNSTSVIGDGNLADVIVTNYTVVGGNAFVEFRIDSFNSELNATFLESVFTDSLPPNRVFGLNNRIVEAGEICYYASATHSEHQRHYVWVVRPSIIILVNAVPVLNLRTKQSIDHSKTLWEYVCITIFGSFSV